MIAERERIAGAIADLILPNEVLMLAAGATTFHVARRLETTTSTSPRGDGWFSSLISRRV